MVAHQEPRRRLEQQRKRRLTADENNDDDQQEEQTGDKSFKICSVLGGLDVTRYISRDARSFFAGAIEDVELIREVVSETATNGGVGHRMTLEELIKTLDRHGRGYDDDDPDNLIQTTLEAGIGYVDDRPDRRMDFWVSLVNLGANRLNYYNSSSKIDARAELAILQATALIFPWIVDRKAKPKFWWISHQNGRSTGARKEPFRFDSLYLAAWIGSWGEAWAYYPPLNKVAGGEPMTLSDPSVGGPTATTHDTPFVKPNLPWNNPSRETYFSKPYPDYAQPGVSIITCMAPVYFTGTIANTTYDDTYIASTGLDILVESLSRLLDVFTNRLTWGSFALLVDLDLDIVVISQDTVEKIYPERTGFEDARVTYDVTGNQVTGDRRNMTYLVSDTIFEGLAKLKNAKWDGLRRSLDSVSRGERDFSKINITLTGEVEAVEFYVMYEKWEYVADWALLAFAPVEEVDNAVRVRIVDTSSADSDDLRGLFLEVEQGESVPGYASIRNDGTLDIVLNPSGTPDWLRLHRTASDGHVLRAGETLNLDFDVVTDALRIGTISSILSFHIRDDSYPDCFYDEQKSLQITVNVSPRDCKRITGDNLRVADRNGECICNEAAVEFWGRCVATYLMLIPFILAGFIFIYAYFERKSRKADSLWEVKKSELIYSDPPEVLGRGTFGLVVSAEYRGTKVAVKRVIPPVTSPTGGTGRVKSSSIIFDYDDDSDDEKAQPQQNGAATKSKSRPQLSRGMISGSFRRSSDAESRPVLSGGMIPGSFRRASDAERIVSSIPGSHLSRSMIPKGFRRASDPGIISGSMKPTGNNGKVSDESTPLNRATKSAPGGNMSGHSSDLTSATSSYRFGSTSRSWAFLKGDFVQEMRVLSKLRHPCITTFMGAVIARGEEPLLVMECMNRGSLYDLLHNSTMIFEGETILSILRDITQGMRFLHSASPRIIHGDLKAANVLVDATFRGKVTDFGFSIKQKVGASGTPYWMAPELLNGTGDNSAASDVYSFGILLYEVYSRRDPYHGEDYISIIGEICDPHINRRPPEPECMPSEVRSLLYSSCLNADPATRPIFAELDGFLKRFQAENVDPGEQVVTLRQSNQAVRLLEEIFPPHIAAALREGRKVEPEHFDCVTIFFSDIVGFTTLSAKMTPLKVSNMVDRLYDKMDALSHEIGVYKLETIGDAWVGVTNLYPACPNDHVKRMALFSMEASRAASECLIDESDPSQGFVQIRIGFHSGPCTTAVVGRRLPKYSVFGDTINTASRMESNSLPGRIHCSDRSEELLRVQAPKIHVQCRGQITVKGKGEMTTYWVCG